MPRSLSGLEEAFGILADRSAGIRAFLYVPERSFSNDGDCVVVFRSTVKLAGFISDEKAAVQQDDVGDVRRVVRTRRT